MIFFQAKNNSEHQIGLEYIHDTKTELSIRLPINDEIYMDKKIKTKILKYSIFKIYDTMLRLGYIEINKYNL